MRQILSDLWETDVERPAPGLTTHAYLWTGSQGNILFYNTSKDSAWPVFQRLGGVAWQLLSHQDEVGQSLQIIRERFGTKLGIHMQERTHAAEFCEPDLLFDGSGQIFDGVTAIHTPGHTPGSTCFLVSGQDGMNYLFTGDTLYRAKDGSWRAGMIEGFSNRAQLRNSLHLLQAQTPDVVIGSAFSGDTGYQRVTGSQWPQLVDDALAALG